MLGRKRPKLEVEVPIDQITTDADERLSAAHREAGVTAGGWPLTTQVSETSKRLADANGFAALLSKIVSDHHAAEGN